MDAVNQLIEQLKTFFASMTPAARLTAGLLLAVVVVSVAFLFRQSTSSPDAYLFGAEALSSREIMSIEAAFGRAGLSDYDISGNKIRVPGLLKSNYIAAIAEAGAMPVSVVDEISHAIGNASPLQSAQLTSEQLRDSKAKVLSRMIEGMSYVSRAVVLFSEEKLPGLGGRKRAGATVTIQPLVGEDIDHRRARIVREMVSGWNPSLKPENVTIIDQTDGSTISGISGGESPDDFEDQYHRTLLAYEKRIRGKVMERLSYINGLRVQVTAVLNDRLSSRSQSIEATKDPLIKDEQTKSNDQRITMSGPGGRPGVDSQGARRDDSESSANSSVNQTESKDERTRELKGTLEKTERYAGMVPKEVEATVGIPRDYVVASWKQKKLLETGEIPEQVDWTELQTFQQEFIDEQVTAIEPMLKDPSGAQDEYTSVTVNIYDAVPGPEIPAPSIAGEALFFARQHASTAGMVLLGLFGLLMLRSVVNGGGSGDDPLPSLQLQTAGGEAVDTSDSDAEDDETGPKLTLKKPESLKDDLAQIVRDDPDGAAAILRSWIGNAS